MLRYVPGFTRVESSGGEVNENITMRGILGVEYVMFMEDGMPVFPTMHTFFMKFPLDLIFLDREMKVRRLYEDVAPKRKDLKLKFLVTSRPYDDSKFQMQKFPPGSDSLSMELGSKSF